MKQKLQALRQLATRNARRLAVAAAAGMATAAQATVDAQISTDIAGYGSDGKTYATLIVSAGFGIWAVKKLGRKMGWW